MAMPRWLLPALAVALAAWALWVLEGARAGVTLTETRIGATPVTIYEGAQPGPPVVIAHGFAGSRQMMQGYALVLAQAGYSVHAFDFEGHGQNPVPMSGDVDSITGTTQNLVDQTRAIMDAAARFGDAASDTPIALIGHSMATDILVRVADEDPRAGPLVLISAFSRAITPDHPEAALLIPGAWEGHLADFALETVRMVDPEAGFGETVTSGDVTRRAVRAPYVEHVAILQSRAARAETLDWLNAFYTRDRSAAVPATGWALIAVLAACTMLTPAIARRFARRAEAPDPLGPREWALVAVLPALVAPPLATLIDLQTLPVLVADYLAVHLFLYGLVQLGLLAWLGRLGGAGRLAREINLLAALVLLAWALGTFGLALHRYGANFMPNAPRLWIIAALSLGALPFMLGDALTNFAAPLWRRVAARALFLASLGGAVALDFEGLFFLLMIAPVIVLFFLTFGTMGRAFARRTGPLTAGLGLGLVLAWALGVSFPLFAA
jgi:pimeloyl-ACP methyl ester carboxylesterase